ncbi:MAG: HEAT repeat domain-containing protein, partial [Planctomycetota bacterium]
SKRLSVRLQSWVWLAQAGIVADTESVEDSWDQLSREQRDTLVTIRSGRTIFVGKERLRGLFEKLLNTDLKCWQPPGVHAELLQRLGQLKSEVARRFARRLISERLPKLQHSRVESFALLDGAAWCLSWHPRDEDVPCLLALSRIANERLRQVAWIGLARHGSDRALEPLGRALSGDRPFDTVFMLVDLCNTWRERPKLRWKYLDMLAKAIEKRGMDGHTGGLVEAFSFVAGMRDEIIGCVLGELDAPDEWEKCLEWYRKNRPKE